MSYQRSEKPMSSKLLTMKFMQRAAASGTQSVSSNPQSTGTSDDTSDASVPSPKRIKRSDDSDMQAIRAAMKAAEDKRTAAVAKQAAEAGETEWVLEYPAGTIPSPVAALNPRHSKGASSRDGDNADDTIKYEGRRSYGNFKRKKTTSTNEKPVSVEEAKKQAKAAQMKPYNPDTVDRSLSSLSGHKPGLNKRGQGQRDRRD
ncbi:hypothetical protein FQN57_001370 [Myotisia sp. PD_48]|nr:hypothetical protein FQN57_001370 [Myotisia sp. PD_48]